MGEKSAVFSDDFDRRLNDLPFVPFRFHVSNGETYDVNDPDAIHVNLGSVTLDVPLQTNSDEPLDRLVTISLFHVIKLESLATAASSGT